MPPASVLGSWPKWTVYWLILMRGMDRTQKKGGMSGTQKKEGKELKAFVPAVPSLLWLDSVPVSQPHLMVDICSCSLWIQNAHTMLSPQTLQAWEWLVTSSLAVACPGCLACLSVLVRFFWPGP